MRSERDLVPSRKAVRDRHSIEADALRAATGIVRPRGTLGEELAALDERWIFRRSH